MSLSRWRRQFRVFRSKLGGDISQEVAFAAYLKSKKRQLLSNAFSSFSVKNRNCSKRLAARYRSKIIKSLSPTGRRRRVIKSPNLLLYRTKPNHLRDQLCPSFNRQWRDIPQRLKDKRQGHIKLSNFSFATNPIGTLAQLKKLAEAAAVYADIRLDFVDQKCDDVAPYIVLYHLMKSLPPIFSGGSITIEVAAVLSSVGLDKPLGVTNISTLRHLSYPILPFKMSHRAPPGVFGDKDHQLRPQYKEYIADQFCNALESWLSMHSRDLTIDAAGSLTSSITEALDNAERHGMPDVDEGLGDWSMAGFSRLTPTEAGDDFKLECSVAIVSVGSTISDSLSTAAEGVKQRMDDYVNSHGGKKPERRALLETVMAVQDGITRVSKATEGRRGGVGLMTLANIFSELGDTDDSQLQSVFTILSGKSCLRITSPYQRGTASGESTLRELWFNEGNCASLPPDPAHVFTVGERFAGTILSARFTIDPEFVTHRLSA